MSKLEEYYNNNNLYLFKNELDNFAKYIIKKHFNFFDLKNESNDILNDVFLFVLEKLRDERYKFDKDKGNFNSYIYYLVRWYFLNLRYKNKNKIDCSKYLCRLDKENKDFITREIYIKKIEEIVTNFGLDVNINNIIEFLFFKTRRKKLLENEYELKLICWRLYKEMDI